jgi:hypothetical protein
MTRTIPKYLMKMWEGVEVVEIVVEIAVEIQVAPAAERVTQALSPTLASP